MEPISHTAHVVAVTVLLLIIAAGTLALTKRLKLPFTLILVVVGMGLSAVIDAYPQGFGVLRMLEISPDLILFVFLPTLIFESTYNMDVLGTSAVEGRLVDALCVVGLDPQAGIELSLGPLGRPFRGLPLRPSPGLHPDKRRQA